MSEQLRVLRSDEDGTHYTCPDCGDWVAEWMDCPHCGWYDGDAWTAAVKRKENGTEIESAEPLDLEDWR